MIKRMLFSELVDHLPHKEMSLIIGPWQAGKTTLMESSRPLTLIPIRVSGDVSVSAL